MISVLELAIGQHVDRMHCFTAKRDKKWCIVRAFVHIDWDI